MKEWIKNLLGSKEPGIKTPYDVSAYNGLSDFLRNAPDKEKILVFTEAARRANEDQRKTLEKALLLFSR